MTKIDRPVLFPPVSMDKILGQVVSEHGLRQLRTAETEKYAHVTYFFNGRNTVSGGGSQAAALSQGRADL